MATRIKIVAVAATVPKIAAEAALVAAEEVQDAGAGIVAGEVIGVEGGVGIKALMISSRGIIIDMMVSGVVVMARGRGMEGMMVGMGRLFRRWEMGRGREMGDCRIRSEMLLRIYAVVIGAGLAGR